MSAADPEIDQASKVLESLDTEQPLSFWQVVNAMYENRFTGTATFHFHDGRLKLIDLGRPIRLRIRSGASQSLTEKS